MEDDDTLCSKKAKESEDIDKQSLKKKKCDRNDDISFVNDVEEETPKKSKKKSKKKSLNGTLESNGVLKEGKSDDSKSPEKMESKKKEKKKKKKKNKQSASSDESEESPKQKKPKKTINASLEEDSDSISDTDNKRKKTKENGVPNVKSAEEKLDEVSVPISNNPLEVAGDFSKFNIQPSTIKKLKG